MVVKQKRRARDISRAVAAVAMIGLASAATPTQAASAASSATTGRRSTPALLQDAVGRGEIDQATADVDLAAVFAGGGVSTNVPARFQGEAPWDGTLPLLRMQQRLAAQPPGPTKARAQAALAASTSCSSSGGSSTPLPNETTSQHFYLNYDTVAGGLTVSSYLSSLEASWGKEVTSYGWAAPPPLAPPPPAPIGTKYPVRVESLTGGLYGFVSTTGTGAGFVGNNPNTPWSDQDAYASCMVLNRDYGTFGGSSQVALDATTAHEFNHSIQFGYGAIAGPNVPDDSMFEGGAAWMEDEVFDSANDNYGYLWPNFRDSLGDYDAAPGSGPFYGFWLMLRGLTERFGTGVPGGGEQVMQDFWELTSQNLGNNLSALSTALANKGVTLADAYHDFAVSAGFMRPCGGGYTLPNCFEEAAGYVAAAGGLPPVAGSIGTPGGSFTSTIEDDYSLAWVTLPASSSYSVNLANNDVGGQLRATVVCDTGTQLVRTGMPAVVGAGATTTLASYSSMGCNRTLAVITNQQQSPGNPSASPSRSFTLSTGVAGPNQPPVANDDAFDGYKGTPLTVGAPGVLANDSDPNGNPITAGSVTGQTGGTVRLNANGSFTFTPTAGFTGVAGFSYTTSDNQGGTDTATVSITVRAVTDGYRLVARDGGIFSFGPRLFHGSTGGIALARPIVGGTTNPAGFDGYWIVASDGGVFAFNVPYFGSLSGQALAAPAVAIEATPSGRGYWIVLADGTVRGFGDAGAFGDLSGFRLDQPVISISATASGRGYWLVSADGGVFSFGDARFFGSTGGVALNAPVVDLSPARDGNGYYLVARDGGVFSYGSATFKGSTGSTRLNAPIVGMLGSSAGGYWLAATDGGVFNFGAPFLGSVGGTRLNAPVLGIIG